MIMDVVVNSMSISLKTPDDLPQHRYTNNSDLSILRLLKCYIVNVDECGDGVGVWDPYA